MSAAELLTAEEFVSRRDELPDGGRWTELHDGHVVVMSPPEVEHGNCVLNLGKMLAEHASKQGDGYACFDLGLVTRRRPDTVLFPAACYFREGPMFAESDVPVTESRPALVIEIASSNDRRRKLSDRAEAYHRWGVAAVWVIDLQGTSVYIMNAGEGAQRVSETQRLLGGKTLPGFGMKIGDLFVEPKWWRPQN